MTEQIQQGPLQALVRFYDRMQNAPALGRSQVKFGWAVVLNESGHPVDVVDLRDQLGKKPANRFFMVPAEVKRTAGISRIFSGIKVLTYWAELREQASGLRRSTPRS